MRATERDKDALTEFATPMLRPRGGVRGRGKPRHADFRRHLERQRRFRDRAWWDLTREGPWRLRHELGFMQDKGKDKDGAKA